MERMLFCRVGWMPYYRGESHIEGGGEWVEDHGYGYEIYNFKPDEQDNLYGHVEAGREMAIDRLGASHRAESVSPVLVVWVATHPGGGMRIVGWYKSATVFRELQPCPQHLVGKRPLPEANEHWRFRIVAKQRDAVLVKESERTFPIPKATKYSRGMGEKNIWYADSPKDQDLRQKVLEYIRSYEAKLSGSQSNAVTR